MRAQASDPTSALARTLRKMRRRPPLAALVALAALTSLASLASCKSLAVEDGKSAGIRPPIRPDDRRDASILAAPDAAHSAEPVVVAEPPLRLGNATAEGRRPLPRRRRHVHPRRDLRARERTALRLRQLARRLLARRRHHHRAHRRRRPRAAAERRLRRHLPVLRASTRIGGHYPDHLWAIVDVSSRMVQASELRVGTAKAEEWKVADRQRHQVRRRRQRSRDRHAAPRLRQAARDARRVDARARDDRRARRRRRRDRSFAFRLLSPSGALVAKPKVPGADLAKIAFGFRGGVSAEGIVALASGEVLGVRKSGDAAKLVRWSPAQPVDDLPLKGTKSDASLPGREKQGFRAARRRRSSSTTAPRSSPRSSRRSSHPASPGRSARTTRSTSRSPNKTLLVETAQGTVTEEPMPAFGGLQASAASSTLWLVSDHERQLHRRTKTGLRRWEPVALPAPPFGNALRGPQHHRGRPDPRRRRRLREHAPLREGLGLGPARALPRHLPHEAPEAGAPLPGRPQRRDRARRLRVAARRRGLVHDAVRRGHARGDQGARQDAIPASQRGSAGRPNTATSSPSSASKAAADTISEYR